MIETFRDSLRELNLGCILYMLRKFCVAHVLNRISLGPEMHIILADLFSTFSSKICFWRRKNCFILIISMGSAIIWNVRRNVQKIPVIFEIRGIDKKYGCWCKVRCQPNLELLRIAM